MDLVYYISLLIITLITILHVLENNDGKKMSTIPYYAVIPLAIFIIYKFSFKPITIYDDKWAYLHTFLNSNWESVKLAKDKGWALYVLVCKSLFNNEDIFFTLNASFYIGGYLIFAKRIFSSKYIFIYILCCVISFGFSGYGTNTIRAGVALAFLLISISYHAKKLWFIFFGLLAISFHLSMLLPLIAFIITRYTIHYKYFISFWIFCFVISAINISPITEFVANIMKDSDDRVAGYLSDKDSERYNIGFRIDFIIYSLIPLILSFYYTIKLKIEDKFYYRILCTYLLTNGVWILAIRMAFTDRLAYLSWFLIPFLLLYPLLKYNLPLNQRNWVALILLGTLSFMSYMYFI